MDRLGEVSLGGLDERLQWSLKLDVNQIGFGGRSMYPCEVCHPDDRRAALLRRADMAGRDHIAQTSARNDGTSVLGLPNEWAAAQNYGRVFVEGRIARSFMNSVLVTTVSCVFLLLLGSTGEPGIRPHDVAAPDSLLIRGCARRSCFVGPRAEPRFWCGFSASM